MDIYSKAIEFFKTNQDKILEVWDDPKSHWTGVLFQSVTPDGTSQENEEGLFCGDLCEIRSLLAAAWTYPLQEQITNDARIPKIYSSNNHTPKIYFEMLEVFAEWQRKIDIALNRFPENFKYESN